MPLTGRSPASFAGTCRIICTTAGVRSKISPVLKHPKTSQGHQIFSGPVVHLAEAYLLMMVLPSTLRARSSPKGQWWPPSVQMCHILSAAAEGANRSKWDSLLCFRGLQAGVTGLGRSNGKPRLKAASSQNSISDAGLPNSRMPLHSCFSQTQQVAWVTPSWGHSAVISQSRDEVSWSPVWGLAGSC